MIRLHHLCVAAALCAASPAGAASAGPHLDPLNRPAAGAAVTPDVAPDQSLGMATLGAKVYSDGSLKTAAGATAVIHINTGLYEVDFNRNVSSCIYSATVSYPPNVTVNAQPRASKVTGVFLSFTNPTSGNGQDSDFFLTVFCNG